MATKQRGRMVCPSCGAEQREGDSRCSECKAELPEFSISGITHMPRKDPLMPAVAIGALCLVPLAALGLWWFHRADGAQPAPAAAIAPAAPAVKRVQIET